MAEKQRNKTCGYSTDAKPGSEALLEGQAGMNGSHLSRIIAPIVTTMSLAAGLILAAYAARPPPVEGSLRSQAPTFRETHPPARIATEGKRVTPCGRWPAS